MEYYAHRGETRGMNPTLDVLFRVIGTELPTDHGYALFGDGGRSVGARQVDEAQRRSVDLPRDLQKNQGGEILPAGQIWDRRTRIVALPVLGKSESRRCMDLRHYRPLRTARKSLCLRQRK